MNYQLALKQLLECTSLASFMKIADKYIKVHNNKPIRLVRAGNLKWKFEESQRNQEIGDCLLSDGIFLKKYCSLFLISDKGSYVNQNLFKQNFYQDYKEKITKNEEEFSKYFKIEVARSLKKFSVGASRKSRKIVQLSGFSDEQTTQNIDMTIFSQAKSLKANVKKSQVKKRMAIDLNDQQSVTPDKNNLKRLSEEEKEIRYSGIRKIDNKLENQIFSAKKPKVIPFEQFLKSDKKFAEDHKKLIAEQGERTSLHSTINKMESMEQNTTEVLRQSPFIRKLTTKQLQRRSTLERQTIGLFPNITMIASMSQLQKFQQKFLGSYGGNSIYLVVVEDLSVNCIKRGIMLRKQEQRAQQNIPDEQQRSQPEVFIEDDLRDNQ